MRVDAQAKRVGTRAGGLEGGIEIVRVADWDRFGWLRHGFSTRMGGVSTVYGAGAADAGGSPEVRGSALDGVGWMDRSLNLGWTKEDDPAAVAENRRRFLAGVWGTLDGFSLVGVRQVHSGVVRVVREGDGALEGRLATPEGKAVLEGDGLMTNVPGVLVGVGTADCVPVLVVDVEKRVVAAFHAGWRGTVARIVERGVGMMVEEYGSRVEDLVAAVGPSIGACCYTVGEQVRGSLGRGLGMLRSFSGLIRGRCGWIFGRRTGGSWWRLGWGRGGLRWWGSVRGVLGRLVGGGGTFRIGRRRVWRGGC